MNMAFFKRKSVCVVTGGSSGIGKEIATQFAQQWASEGAVGDMVLISRSHDKMQGTKQAIEGVAPSMRVHLIAADLSELDSLEEVCSKAWAVYDEQQHEQVVLVHNAGSIGDISKPMSEQTDPHAIQHYMGLNFTSPWVMSASFLSRFTSGHRLIINVTSLLGRVAMAGFAAYGAGKAARSILMEVLGKENPQVRLLNYSPGPVDTAMYKTIMKELYSPEGVGVFKDAIASGKLLSPEQSIAKLVAIVKEDSYSNACTIDYYDE